MSFTAAVVEKTVFGNKRMIKGTWVNDGGSTGGDITTGLARCDAMSLQITGASAAALAPSVNEVLPLAGGVVTVVTNANDAGNWIAEGV